MRNSFCGLTALQSEGGAARRIRGPDPCICECPPSTRLRTDCGHARGYRTLHGAAANLCVRGLRFLAPSCRGRRFRYRRYIFRVVDEHGGAGQRQIRGPCRYGRILTAGTLLLAWVFKLGFLADFLSHTVLVGFLTGVGFQVGIAMLSDMLGVSVHSRRTLVQGWEVLQGLSQANVATVALSTLVAGSILLGNHIFPRLPFSLFAVVGTIAASAAFHFAENGIPVIGPVSGGLPSIGLPDVTWSEALALVPVAASCFAIIIAQSAATSRAFALRYHESVDADADILGLSLANAVAAISGAFVVNGSPTQTAMADRAGARSQIAHLAFAGVILLVLLFLTGPLQYLPRCVLASIVFTIAFGMIDVTSLRNIRRESPGEFYLAVVTAAAVVAIGVEQGILLAVVLSIFRHVRHSYNPHAMLFAPDVTGRWVPVPATPGKETEPRTHCLSLRFRSVLREC